AGIVAVDAFDVGPRGVATRTPVDDSFGAVDEPVVVQPLEMRLYGAGQTLVHREPFTGPVDAVAELTHLAQDQPAGLFLPLPDAREKILPTDVVPRNSLTREFALDDVLRRDAGMVHSGPPLRGVAQHSPAPDPWIDQPVL